MNEGRGIRSPLYECKVLMGAVLCLQPMRLDRVDIGILSALQEDARLSFRDLSRRGGGSVPTISARGGNLRNRGILTGFHASVDPGALWPAAGPARGRCRAPGGGAVGLVAA